MENLLTFILLSMILANTGHMLLVKAGAFPRLARPVSERHFGRNKTWRGFVLLACLNALFSIFLNSFWGLFSPPEAGWIGAMLGLVYMLSELPNSWLKRRLGVAAGARASRHPWLFTLMDKTDSSLGVSLVSMFWFRLSWQEGLLLFGLGSLLHALISWLLVLAGWKRRL